MLGLTVLELNVVLCRNYLKLTKVDTQKILFIERKFIFLFEKIYFWYE